MTGRPRVTIAGGGIAGLTAALRLAKRGYQVKVYEQNSMLGGDLGSRTAPNGVHHDVYPHMYLLERRSVQARAPPAPPLPASVVRRLRRGPSLDRRSEATVRFRLEGQLWVR